MVHLKWYLEMVSTPHLSISEVGFINYRSENAPFSPHLCSCSRCSLTGELCFCSCWPTSFLNIADVKWRPFPSEPLPLLQNKHQKNSADRKNSRWQTPRLTWLPMKALLSVGPLCWTSCQFSRLMQEEMVHDHWPRVTLPFLILLPLISPTVIAYGCLLFQVLNGYEFTFFRETEPTRYRCGYLRFTVGISSCDYRGWKVPRYPICKWKDQGSQGAPQSEWKLKNRGRRWCKSQNEGLGTRGSEVQGQQKMDVPAQEERIRPSSFLFYSSSLDAQPYRGGCSSFLSLLIQIHFWKHPRQSQKYFTSYLGILAQLTDMKVNHHKQVAPQCEIKAAFNIFILYFLK